MILEELIHVFWRNSAELCSIVPSERFITGSATFIAKPCVSLFSEKEEVLFHTNRPVPWKKIGLRFELTHDSFDAGIRIAELIERNFDRLRLDDEAEKRSFVFGYYRGENTKNQDESWLFIRRFRVIG